MGWALLRPGALVESDDDRSCTSAVRLVSALRHRAWRGSDAEMGSPEACDGAECVKEVGGGGFGALRLGVRLAAVVWGC